MGSVGLGIDELEETAVSEKSGYTEWEHARHQYVDMRGKNESSRV